VSDQGRLGAPGYTTNRKQPSPTKIIQTKIGRHRETTTEALTLQLPNPKLQQQEFLTLLFLLFRTSISSFCRNKQECLFTNPTSLYSNGNKTQSARSSLATPLNYNSLENNSNKRRKLIIYPNSKCKHIRCSPSRALRRF
jgi:hypothetical protein